MYISRLCRYRGVTNGALDAVRFASTRSGNMRKYSPKNSVPPSSLPSDQPRNPQVPSSSSPSDQFVFNGDSAIQRIQDIARSLEQISINSSTSSPLAGRPPAIQQATSITYPDPQVSSSSHRGSRSKTSKMTKTKNKNGRDEKQAPSAASGGVPYATPEYLQACNSVPQFTGKAKNLLVVIDLNGTLLYRPSRTQPKHFLTRPHARLFLKYCIDTFTVVIWSSARPENVKAMCEVIMPPNLRSKVTAIWGRDKFGLSPDDYNLRVQCYKKLQKVWTDKKIAATHPTYALGDRWDQTNTVLIDDSAEKAQTEPHNLIEVPEWFGDLNEPDDILPQVHDHLNILSQHTDVSACLRANPFKAQPGGLRRPQ